MKKSRILFICLLFATGLYAEDQVLQLTLSEAQEYAVQQNRSLKNASLAVQQAKMQRWQTLQAEELRFSEYCFPCPGNAAIRLPDPEDWQF